MSSERATVETRSEPIRGPWEDPVKAALPATLPGTAPRLELTDQALVLASQNAFPVVATQRARRDHLGLAAGGAIALVLGCATFVSLSSSRHAPASTAVAQTSANPMQVRQPLPAPGLPMPMPVTGSTAPSQLPAPMAGMNPMPGAMVMPGSPPASAPVLVYDGSAPRMP